MTAFTKAPLAIAYRETSRTAKSLLHLLEKLDVSLFSSSMAH